jgi:hypothetical protein
MKEVNSLRVLSNTHPTFPQAYKAEGKAALSTTTKTGHLHKWPSQRRLKRASDGIEHDEAGMHSSRNNH